MKKLDNFIENLKGIFGNRLLSVFIYGSKASQDSVIPAHDTDIMVITDTLSGEDIRKCSKAAKNWIYEGRIFKKAVNPAPIFMSEKEWLNSADVYAMEYADIKENHRIVYGENLICDISVDKPDLRLECELQTKNLLMRFRNHYLLYSDNTAELQKSIVPVTKALNAIFKAVLRLKNIEVSKSPHENLNRVHEIFEIDKKLYEKLLCSKEKHCSFKKHEIIETADEIVFELQKLLGFINNL